MKMTDGDLTTAELKDQFNDLERENRKLKDELFRLQLMSQDDTSKHPKNDKYETELAKYAVNSVSEIIYACDTDGSIIFTNSKFRSLQITSKNISCYKTYEIDKLGFCQQKWNKLISKLKNNNGYYRYSVTINGETFDVVSHLTKDKKGENIAWLFVRNITIRVMQDNKIKELNYVMDAILNNIPVYLFVKDPANELRYLYWNKAFAEHAKIPVEKVLGKTDFEIFPNKTDANKFHQDDLELLKNGKKVEFNEEYITAEGETRIVHTLKDLIPSGQATPWLIGVSWDITDLKRTEKELIEAREKAVQSDKLKSAFLANMSHEIRTPLNAIVGFSKLMTDTIDDEDKKQYSAIIDDNADLLLQLINDILDISKIEAGTLDFIDKEASLDELCRNMYEIHNSKVRKEVKLIYDDNHFDAMLHCDTNRLCQVITNLLTNAIKFTKQGEIHFGFTKKEDSIELYVKDTGIGMEEKEVTNIFNRFVKLNNFAQGTGLGLSICRMIVEKFEGTIWAKSVVGEGSTFFFTIPDKVICANVVKNIDKNETSQLPLSSQCDKTILIAEDIDSNYILLKSYLGKSYKLIRALNGLEAIDLFKKEKPDLILMDIKMPIMDGLEATRNIRQISKTIPIIALTAFAFESDKQKALKEGFSDFVSKPVSLDILKQLIKKHL